MLIDNKYQHGCSMTYKCPECDFHCPWSEFWKWCVYPQLVFYLAHKVCEANQSLDHLCKQTDYRCSIFCNVGYIRGHTNWGFPWLSANLPLDQLCKCFGWPMPMRIIGTRQYFARYPQQNQSKAYRISSKLPLPAHQLQLHNSSVWPTANA